jgi:hypothetical protein
MTHPHNLPGISGHEFLLAVMHDPTVDLHDAWSPPKNYAAKVWAISAQFALSRSS